MLRAMMAWQQARMYSMSVVRQGRHALYAPHAWVGRTQPAGQDAVRGRRRPCVVCLATRRPARGDNRSAPVEALAPQLLQPGIKQLPALVAVFGARGLAIEQQVGVAHCQHGEAELAAEQVGGVALALEEAHTAARHLRWLVVLDGLQDCSRGGGRGNQQVVGTRRSVNVGGGRRQGQPAGGRPCSAPYQRRRYSWSP
jgi:hypothetical protein